MSSLKAHGGIDGGRSQTGVRSPTEGGGDVTRGGEGRGAADDSEV